MRDLLFDLICLTGTTALMFLFFPQHAENAMLVMIIVKLISMAHQLIFDPSSFNRYFDGSPESVKLNIKECNEKPVLFKLIGIGILVAQGFLTTWYIPIIWAITYYIFAYIVFRYIVKKYESTHQ